MTKNENWSKTTTAIYNGILLYSIAGLLHAIVDPIADLAEGASMFAAFAGAGSGSEADGLTTFANLLLAGIIGGYILFFNGLTSFARILDAGDSTAVGKIRTGVILGLIATAIGFIPLTGIICGIINIIAFFMMLTAYSTLKNSPTFPPAARGGAGNLYTSQILLIVGVVLGWIPLIGGVFEAIIKVIAFIMVLIGWSTIRKVQPEPPTYSMPDEPQQ
jgi:uncharacterized membrane protein